MNNIILKDVNGQQVIVSGDEIFAKIMENEITLYGMPMDAIREFRHQYMLKGGVMPITRQGIKIIFQD